MPTVYGTNSTLALTSGGIGTANLIARGQQDAVVQVMVDTYEAAALASDSTIYMGRTLPTGARVIGVKLAYDALSTVTLSVGDAADVDRYIADTATGNAAGNSDAILVDGMNYVVGTASSDNQIVIKTTGVSTATGTIKVAVYYTQA